MYCNTEVLNDQTDRQRSATALWKATRRAVGGPESALYRVIPSTFRGF